MQKQLTFEKYLYLTGYITKGTSTHKIKANSGACKFAKDIFQLLNNMDFIEIQNKIKEMQSMNK